MKALLILLAVSGRPDFIDAMHCYEHVWLGNSDTACQSIPHAKKAPIAAPKHAKAQI
jgi:hypothetical protein